MARATFASWEQIFAAKNFDTSKDVHFITPDEIKAIAHKEPRLMAKMDSSEDVPPIFKKYGYFLLPVGRSNYAIVRGNGFHALESAANDVEQFTSKIKFNLTTSGRNTSEMQYLDYCANAGLIEHVVNDGILYSSIRGREGSGSFKFRVGAANLDINAAQIEVDLGLEGENKIVLMEAKSKTPQDFIIRQLYYPYRRFNNLLGSKEVIPIFFTYDASQETYNYWVYKFNDMSDYNSIELVQHRSFNIRTPEAFKLEELRPEAQVRYKGIVPQANDLDKVMELIFKVGAGMSNAKDVAAYFKFDSRQSSYYREAAEALGFVYVDGGVYKLTETGQHLISLSVEDRSIFFSRVLSNFKLVKDMLGVLRSKGKLGKPDVERLIVAESMLSGTTIGRRADSLIAWFKWIAEKTGAFTYSKGEFELV